MVQVYMKGNRVMSGEFFIGILIICSNILWNVGLVQEGDLKEYNHKDMET